MRSASEGGGTSTRWRSLCWPSLQAESSLAKGVETILSTDHGEFTGKRRVCLKLPSSAVCGQPRTDADKWCAQQRPRATAGLAENKQNYLIFENTCSFRISPMREATLALVEWLLAVKGAAFITMARFAQVVARLSWARHASTLSAAARETPSVTTVSYVTNSQQYSSQSPRYARSEKPEWSVENWGFVMFLHTGFSDRSVGLFPNPEWPLLGRRVGRSGGSLILVVCTLSGTKQRNFEDNEHEIKHPNGSTSPKTRYSIRSTGCSSPQRRTVARTIRPRRPTRRPLVARRSFSTHRIAQGSGCARNSEEATQGISPCSGCPSQALDQTLR